MTRGIAAVVVVLGLLVGLYVLSLPEIPETATTVDMELESLRQRAEQGDADAQYNLGFVYDTGLGVPQDYTEAAAWYRLAADQGHTDAQHNLGIKYHNGEGVPQDDVEAAKWYRLAADQGHTDAQHNLGVMYSTGEGLPQDDVEAHKWVNLAAARTTGDDQKRHAETRDALAKLMTPAQVAEAQQLAREWQAAFDARQE